MLRKLFNWLGLSKPIYSNIDDGFNDKENLKWFNPNNEVKTEWNEWGNDIWKNRWRAD